MTLHMVLASRFFTICTRVVIPFILITELYLQLFIIAPTLFKNRVMFYAYSIILLFLVFNLIGNSVFLIMTDTSINMDTCTEEDFNVNLCAQCDRNIPPRCVHCSNCKTCIPRRRGHCLLMDNCIGYFNHRYFFVLIVYSLVYSANTVAIEAIFFDQVLLRNDAREQLLPFCIVSNDWAECVFISIFFVSAFMNFFSLITSVFLLTSETDVILVGKLKNERVEKCNYDRGFKKNLICVLGKRWFLVFLCPVIESELPDVHVVLFPRSNKSSNSLKLCDYSF